MKSAAQRGSGRLAAVLPYLWLAAFFLLPFLIVIKISLSQSTMTAPPYAPQFDPAGGWAVLALLGLGALTALSGYATFNDFGGHWLEELHEGAAGAMLALVFVHVGAVLLSSLIHRENLVRAMWNGFKRNAHSGG